MARTKFPKYKHTKLGSGPKLSPTVMVGGRERKKSSEELDIPDGLSLWPICPIEVACDCVQQTKLILEKGFTSQI